MTKCYPRQAIKGTPGARDRPIVERNSPPSHWIMPHADLRRLEEFGVRLEGGGTHQSKTMMLPEVSTYWHHCQASSAHPRALIVDLNILNKRTASARLLTYRHLNALYAIAGMPPIAMALAALWKRDPKGQPLLALLCALARDPLLRESAEPVNLAEVGEAVRWTVIAAQFEERHPGRFSPKTLRSMAQNCASTWTQSGHLQGAVKKQRTRVDPTPLVAAYAALIASMCGFGGPALLDSPWMSVLDVSKERALDLLRHAEGQCLARVRSAGDVLEIAVRKPMAATLGIPQLA